MSRYFLQPVQRLQLIKQVQLLRPVVQVDALRELIHFVNGALAFTILTESVNVPPSTPTVTIAFPRSQPLFRSEGIKIKEVDRGISFFRWSTANIIGFALGGVIASLSFPVIYVAGLLAGIVGLFLFLLLPVAVVGALVGMIISGFAGYAQREALRRKVSQADGWTGRSIKGGLVGGALAGTLGIFKLSGLISPPTNAASAGGPGSLFPINWLFYATPEMVVLLGLAGAVTGLFVGQQQQKGTEGSTLWPLWSALGWGLGWGVTAALAKPLSKAAGLETIVSAAVNASFEDWPAQLGAAALSLALCGFVYALITFLPLIAEQKA